MTRHFLAPLALVFLCNVSPVLAEKSADLKPVLEHSPKLEFEDGFDGAKLGAKWRAVKGAWQIEDGAVVGREKKEDQHAAVLNCAIPNHDSAIQFSFQLDGCQFFHLSFNRAKGHLFRVIVSPRGVTISKDKDKKDPKSKALALAKAEGRIAPGKWHSLLVEVVGDKVVVQLDNGVKLEASHADFDVDKPNYRFVTRGASLLLDDIKIWRTAK